MSDPVTDFRARNNQWLDLMTSENQTFQKVATSAVDDFTRLKVREDGILRRVIPMQQISNDELVPQLDTDNPVKIVEMEPDSPAAISVGFASQPSSWYIYAPRYRVTFARMMTPKFMKDIDQLRTWHMDIREVFSDNSLKDLLAEEDATFFAAVNASMGGSAGAVTPFAINKGAIQWTSTFGGITRDTLQESLKNIPASAGKLEAQKMLVNNVTIRDFQKWNFFEIGGDKSQDILFKGWTEGQLAGKELLVTIKQNLVPTGSMYMFGDPRFIGKLYSLEPTVMHIKREYFMLEWFSYESLGFAIANPTGLARNDFN